MDMVIILPEKVDCNSDRNKDKTCIIKTQWRDWGGEGGHTCLNWRHILEGVGHHNLMHGGGGGGTHLMNNGDLSPAGLFFKYPGSFWNFRLLSFDLSHFESLFLALKYVTVKFSL